MKAKPDSGVVRVGPRVSGGESEVARVCDEILDATTIASVNVDFASDGADGDRRSALADAATAIERVASLVRVIRRMDTTNESPVQREGRALRETARPKAKRSG